MVNKYKRKSQQGSWSEEAMKKAIQEVTEFKKAIKSTATKYGIPRATLQRHLKTGSCKKKLGRFATVFSEEQELELLNYVFEMDSMFYGLTKEDFLQLVFQYAEKNRIPHPFKDGTAGNDWYKGYVTRHPDLTLRKPEPTSIARARGFNKPQVYRFFDLLEEQINKHSIDPTRLYNMDETGIQTSSNKPPRVLTKIGKRQVGLIASTERGRTTTVICCCNAAGSFIPPFMIFARKRMNSRLLDGAPPGTQGTCTDNGWINGEAFLEWLRFFIETVRPTSDKPVILVLDNHESHKYLPALEFASANNVVFISLAPHTTHRMQPLDYCVYGPLKTYFEQAVATFQKAHANRVIKQDDVAGLFSFAFMKAATAQNAIKGFQATGLFPTDRYIFDESDFKPATVTEKPLNTENVRLEKSQLEVIDPERTPSSSILEHIIDDRSQSEIIDPDRTPSPSTLDQIIQSQYISLLQPEDLPTTDSTLLDGLSVNVTNADADDLAVVDAITPDKLNEPFTSKDAPVPDTWIRETLMTPVKSVPLNDRCGTAPIPDTLIQKTLSTPVKSVPSNDVDTATTVDLDRPSTSTNHFSPMVIRPIPKVGPNKTNRRRKTQKAEILTSTPIKDEQRNKLSKKMKPQKEKSKNITKNLKKVLKTEKAIKKNEKPKRRSHSQKENSPYPCLVCNELYVHPPTEDWIQCDDCKMWAHDACTSYSGIGAFYCDICHEI